MRNKFPGTCMECGKACAEHEGFAHRRNGTKLWSVIHATCVQDRYDRLKRQGKVPDRAALITDERSKV